MNYEGEIDNIGASLDDVEGTPFSASLNRSAFHTHPSYYRDTFFKIIWWSRSLFCRKNMNPVLEAALWKWLETHNIALHEAYKALGLTWNEWENLLEGELELGRFIMVTEKLGLPSFSSPYNPIT